MKYERMHWDPAMYAKVTTPAITLKTPDPTILLKEKASLALLQSCPLATLPALWTLTAAYERIKRYNWKRGVTKQGLSAQLRRLIESMPYEE